MEMVRLRRPVSEVLADPQTDAGLRHKLILAAEALQFAHRDLQLPDNGSYRDYADLRRPFAVWNVFVAGEFSLELKTWCFPVAGCVGYRGYFHEEDARVYAAKLAADGDDVYVGGAAAYSTLGYFRDPLLSTAMQMPDWAVAGLVFHELAHQKLYLSGDTKFNESFASAVEQEGITRWLVARNDRDGWCAHERAMGHEREFRKLLADTRERLAAIYQSDAPLEERRAAKVRALTRLTEEYRQLRRDRGLKEEASGVAPGSLNNAALGALAAYDEYAPAFRQLLRAEGGQIGAFYERAAGLARLADDERRRQLEDLAVGAPVAPVPQISFTCSGSQDS